MPTDWKHFRKIAENPDPEFLCLPAWVRGYASEMVRIARRPDGHLVTACHGLSRSSQLLGVLLRAHPDETEMIERAVTLLLEDGFLEERDEALWIPNFQAAQESDEARRQRESRGKRKPSRSVTPVTDGHTESRPVTEVTYKKRGEEIRSEEITQSAREPEPAKAETKPVTKPKPPDRLAFMDAHENPEVLWAFERWVDVFEWPKDTSKTSERMTALQSRFDETVAARRDWRADVELVLKAGKADPWVSGECRGELLRMFDKRSRFEKFRQGPPPPKRTASNRQPGDVSEDVKKLREKFGRVRP